MKRLMVPVFAVLLVILPAIVLTVQRLSGGPALRVLLAYHPEYSRKAPGILEAYESVLREEGVPYERIDVHDLAATSVGDLAQQAPVIILPDSVLQSLPERFAWWARRYLGQGGNLLVVYDAGVKDGRGFFLDTSALATILDLNTITYAATGVKAYAYGSIQFASSAHRDFFQIPPGKTDERLFLSGYRYGKLRYPLARTEPLAPLPAERVYAYGVTDQNEKFPAIVLTEYSRGTVLYVDLPLGHLKANADDLPLRAVLRTFLFDIVSLPHLVNGENGRGGVVINWHIDSNIEHETLPRMRDEGLLRKDVPASFHITAGDYCYEPGDGAGFDACGKGRPLVELLKAYGTIGSHGGWGHNWFAEKIRSGAFHEKEMRQYIARNTACLESITGGKITEYSAPNGMQPQPASAHLLQSMGFIAYYTTGDAGSPPTRSFHNGAMLSAKAVAFPITPYGRSASLAEMSAMDHRTESEVSAWLSDLLSYTVRTRTTRLFYSHPNNISRYPRAVKAFIERAASLQQQDAFAVRTMNDYAVFFLRFLKTTGTFRKTASHLAVSLRNPEGLAGICVAVPKAMVRMPSEQHLSIQEDERYYYLTVKTNDKKIHIDIPARGQFLPAVR